MLLFVLRIEYLGFTISAQGRSPVPHLLNAIKQAPAPTDVKSLRSFLGMISFYSCFIPHFSTVSHPMRVLTQQGVPFEWSQKCAESFEKCKALLTSSQLHVHYDPKLPIVLYVDASTVGIGCVLYYCHGKGGRTSSYVCVRFPDKDTTSLRANQP